MRAVVVSMFVAAGCGRAYFDEVTDATRSDSSSPDSLAPDGPRSTRFAFITSELYTGGFGGLAGADANCQRLADAQTLPGTYKAFLSDGTTAAVDRLAHGTLPYVLPTGERIADDWNALTSAPLQHAIDRTESGAAPPTGNHCNRASSIWSNSFNSGQRVGFHCNNWSDSTTAFDGAAGEYAFTAINWSYNGCSDAGKGCTAEAALVCLEQ